MLRKFCKWGTGSHMRLLKRTWFEIDVVTTDLPVKEFAYDVGYSSNQVLARVFIKHRHMSQTGYRRAVRDPVRSIAQH